MLINIGASENKMRITIFIDFAESSGSDKKLLFDYDRLIGLQKSIFRSDHRFSILYDLFSFTYERFFDFF